MTGEPEGRRWSEIDRVSPEELGDPVLQLHWAAQLVASAGQTFAEPVADDSHRAMTWSDAHAAFVGADFAGPYPFRVALRPRDLTILLLDRTEQTLGTLPLRGRSRSEGYEWLSVAMATYLGGPPPRIERPEYDVPPHPVEAGGPFDVTDEALATLESLYGGAAGLLADVASERSDASAIRCWPHHFDIATLVTVATEDADRPARTVGAGLAPMGGGYESWYWYVAPWPYPDPDDLPELDGPGSWHTEGWTGAMLPGAVVTAAPAEGRRGLVRGFLDEAIEACEAVLSR